MGVSIWGKSQPGGYDDDGRSPYLTPPLNRASHQLLRWRMEAGVSEAYHLTVGIAVSKTNTFEEIHPSCAHANTKNPLWLVSSPS